LHGDEGGIEAGNAAHAARILRGYRGDGAGAEDGEPCEGLEVRLASRPSWGMTLRRKWVTYLFSLAAVARHLRTIIPCFAISRPILVTFTLGPSRSSFDDLIAIAGSL
jgi:hypothetical protein